MADKPVTAKERAKKIKNSHHIDMFWNSKAFLKDTINEIKSAEEAARAEGYAEGLALGPGFPEEMYQKGYALGFAECREKAAGIAQRCVAVLPDKSAAKSQSEFIMSMILRLSPTPQKDGRGK